MVTDTSNGTILGLMEGITLFLFSLEIVEWRLEIAHTSDEGEREDPQWDGEWNGHWSEE